MKKLATLLTLFITVVSFNHSIAQSGCSASWTASINGSMANFTNTSSGGALSYYWDFGDGNNSWSTNPSNTYATSGVYTVCLTIFDSLTQCQDQYCDTISINASGPNCNANFTYSVDSINGCVVYFNNTSTGTGLIYDWYFDDGNNSTSTNPTHVYASSGVYTVCLIVYDQQQTCFDSICIPITVNCASQGGCNASFTYSANGGLVQFTNTSTGLYYDWDFGDGGTSTQTNPTYTYNSTGTFWVCLNAYDSTGWCDSTCQQITITGPQGIYDHEATVSLEAVFPNPTLDQLNMNITAEKQEAVTLNIYNALGQVVFTESKTLLSGKNTVALDVNDLEQGMYTLVLIQENTAGIYQKFIKK